MRGHCHIFGRQRPLLILVTLLFPCVFCAGVACGQGTSNLLPEPISTTRVLQYADRLDLDDAQMDTLLASHEVYLDQFLQLRETRIRRLLETAKAVRASSYPTIPPDRDALRGYLAEHARISSSIVRIEKQMFDLLEADLRDDQRPGLESIRLGRQRERLMAPLLVSMWLTQNLLVDFRLAGSRLDLTDEEAAQFEPVLLAYERAAVERLERIDRAAREMIVNWVDACAARGVVNDGDLKDWFGPEAQLVALESLHATWDGVRAAGREFLIEQAKMMRRIALLMSPDTAHQFRFSCHVQRSATPNLDFRSLQRRGPTFGHIAIALERDDLTEAQRDALAAELEVYQRQSGDMMDERVLLSAEMWGGTPPLQQPDGERERIATEYAERGDANMQSLLKLNLEVAEGVRPILGDAVADEVARAFEGERAARRRESAFDPDRILSVGVWQENALIFLPPQITRADFDLYLDILAFDDDQTTIARTMFADYLDGVRVVRRDKIGRLAELRVAWALNKEETAMEPPPWEGVERSEATRGEVVAAINRLGDALLSDLDMLTYDGPQAESMAVVRLHQACRRLAQYERRSSGGFREYSGWRVNLVEAVAEAELTDQERADALAVVAVAAPRLIEAYRAQRTAHLEMWRAKWRMNIEVIAPQQAGAPAEQSRIDELSKKLSNASKRCARARTSLVQLNHAILDQIGFEPESDQHAALLAAYRRAAYPKVYETAGTFRGRLQAAEKIADLDAGQSAAIAAVRDEAERGLEAAWAGICDAYEASSHQGVLEGGDTEAWNDYQRRKETVEKLVFQRGEVAGRALAKLKEILTEAQLARLNASASSDGRDSSD